MANDLNMGFNYSFGECQAIDISILWHAQAGRAGRREQASVSIYVAHDGPLDQYFMTQPNRLFERPIESAQVCSAPTK